MFLNHTTKQPKTNRRAVTNVRLSSTLVLGLFIQCAVTMSPAYAQGLGPDQESLLPPEVVPLDPQVGSKMSQSQAATRAASMGNNIESQSVPGLSSGSGSAPGIAAGGQSAQDFRQAAFNSMMGQNVTPAPPPINPNLQALQAQNGMMNGQPGQSPWTTPGMTPGMAGNQMAGGMPTQTLSGGIKNPEIGRPNAKMAKLTHGIGMATMLGSGIFMGAAMSRNPASLYSTGLFGLGLANYAFRRF